MRSRDSALDVVRIVATVCVMSVHFFLNSGFYQQPVTGGRMLLMLNMRSAFMVCVPLFLLLTGYLMNQKKLSGGYYKGLIKTVAVYVLMCVGRMIYENILTPGKYRLGNGVAGILNFTGVRYAWYIEMYIGLFLLIPFLNLVYQQLVNRRQKLALVGTLVLLAALPGICNCFCFQASWWARPAASKASAQARCCPIGGRGCIRLCITF